MVLMCPICILYVPPTTAPYTLSLHDALPISRGQSGHGGMAYLAGQDDRRCAQDRGHHRRDGRDRKSTRLNSSHVRISYAVFCLKKKKLYFTFTMTPVS